MRKRRYSNDKKPKCPTQKAFDHFGKVVNVYCGNWACPRCGKVNARLWAWRVRIHIQSSEGRTYFWTLTLGSKYTTPEQGFKALPKLWDTFRKLIQRAIPGRWEYCAVVEGQPKRGYMPHFHIISLTKAPKRLKDLAVQAGFGHQAKEVAINGAQAASYVTKYSTKGGQAMPKGFRRVRVSQGWPKLPDYHGFPLLVKARNEFTSTYLMRVSDITGVDVDTLWERWQDAVWDNEEVDKPTSTL